MTKTTSYPVIAGQIRKVEVISYSNGQISQRTYEKVTDVVPFDVVWLKKNKKASNHSFCIMFKLAKHAVAGAIATDIRQEVTHVLNYRDMMYTELMWLLNLRTSN